MINEKEREKGRKGRKEDGRGKERREREEFGKIRH